MGTERRTMSNAKRWRLLMQWMRYLQDNGLANKLNFEWLQEKVEEIKRGGKVSEENQNES